MGLWQSTAAENDETAPWKQNIITKPEDAIKIAGEAARVAVLGIAPESRADRAAHYVAKSLQDNGVKIVPVPVYYFDIQEILGEKVYRRLQDIPDPDSIDILDVFRRAEDLDPHLPDILELKPKVVWLQSGISDRRFEELVAKAGIKIVPDRCMKVDRANAKAKL
ncbi:hypothetical protein CVIRNUC_005088 [Coccomyxa viridis]|uniref:CoA-binding domain-containing protein n=1 Tax=Coccomyxa viridis TaxID=1274662 RepID=A0AAV1I779_9CHLO|nr:hypothetical protein CVIRNUC_005088 [Coccomyxa viridis]